jgi:hypothetical protein
MNFLTKQTRLFVILITLGFVGLGVGLTGFGAGQCMSAHSALYRIEALKISDLCLQAFPCFHAVTIILEDGREKEVRLNGEAICALIQSTEDKHKIVGEIAHFDQYESQQNAEEILSEIFD